MKVKELMTRAAESCPATTTLAAAADTLWRKDCGALLVTGSKGELVGIATDRDMFIALGTRDRLPSELTLGDVMSRNPATCSPDDDVRSVLEKMRHRKIRRIPVVDAQRIAGILSLDDLVRCAAPTGSNGGLDEADVIRVFKSVCEQRPSLQPEIARR